MDEEENISTQESLPAPRKDRFLPISILVGAVVIGGSVIFSVLYHPAAQTPIAQNNGGTQPQAAAPTMDAGTLGPRDAILGNANAPVTLIEYGDYQCPFCGIFFTQIEPVLKKNYIDTNKVKMVFRDFPFLGPESTAAGAAAECANDQNQFWAYHDALYTAEVADGHENSGNLNRTLFVSLAQNVHLNIAAFTTCLDTNKNATTVADAYAAGQEAGVNSTPTTFVNGKAVLAPNGTSVGANATAIFQAVDAALKG